MLHWVHGAGRSVHPGHPLPPGQPQGSLVAGGLLGKQGIRAPDAEPSVRCWSLPGPVPRGSCVPIHPPRSGDSPCAAPGIRLFLCYSHLVIAAYPRAIQPFFKTLFLISFIQSPSYGPSTTLGRVMEQDRGPALWRRTLG